MANEIVEINKKHSEKSEAIIISIFAKFRDYYAELGIDMEEWQVKDLAAGAYFRGYDESVDPAIYLRPQDNPDLVLPPRDPKDLKKGKKAELLNSKKAAEYLVKNRNKKVAFMPDYDCDGNMSLVIAKLTADLLEIEYSEHMPHRQEGFGLNKNRIDEAVSDGAQVMVVMDNGTEATEMVAYAKEQGIKQVIILDHHLAREGHEFPDALIINDNQPKASGYEKWGSLCAGTLSAIFFSRHVLASYEKKHGDLLPDAEPKEREEKLRLYQERVDAAAGIAAVVDMASLMNPANRYYAARACELINRYPQQVKQLEIDEIVEKQLQDPVSWGLEYLRRFFDISEVTTEDFAFMIGPAINAASRMGYQDLGAQLVYEKGRLEAENMVREIITHNDFRKALVEEAMKELRPAAEGFMSKSTDSKAFIYSSKRFPKEIVGILAARVMQEYGLVSMIGSRSVNGSITYSGRSPKGVPFYESTISKILEAKEKLGVRSAYKEDPSKEEGAENSSTETNEPELMEVVKKIGGHNAAFGLTTQPPKGKEEGYEEQLRNFCQEQVAEYEPQKQKAATLYYLRELSIEELNDAQRLRGLFEVLEETSIQGNGSEAPVYKIPNVRISYDQTMGSHKQHLRFNIVSPEGDLEHRDITFFFEAESELGGVIQSSHEYVGEDGKSYAKLYDLYVVPSKNDQGKTTKVSCNLVDLRQKEEVVEIDTNVDSQTITDVDDTDQGVDELAKAEAEIKKSLEAMRKLMKHPSALLKSDVIKNNISHLKDHTYYDLETTGLDVDQKDPAVANAVSQVAGLRIVEVQGEVKKKERASHADVKVNGYSVRAYKIEQSWYAVLPFNKFMLTTTPAYYEHRKKVKEWEASKEGERPEYKQNICEYQISPEALAVTNTEILRNEYGEPFGIAVAGEKVPKNMIGYPEDIWKEFFEFIDNDDLVAFNSIFDNGGTLRQVTNLFEATKNTISQEQFPGLLQEALSLETKYSIQIFQRYRGELQTVKLNGHEKLEEEKRYHVEDIAEKIENYLSSYPQLRIVDEKARNSYTSKVAPKSSVNGFIFKDRFFESTAYQQLSNPARMKCLMLAALTHMGEGVSNRLDDFAVRYGEEFVRDDSQHDALEDIIPYISIAAKQIEQCFEGGVPNYAELWEVILSEDLGQESGIASEAVEEDYKNMLERKGDIILRFPEDYEDNPAAAHYLEFFRNIMDVNRRNSRSSMTGVRYIDEENGVVVLQGFKDESSRTLQYHGLFKRILFDRAVRSALVDSQGVPLIESMSFFDSLSRVNLTIRGEGNEWQRTAQHIPLSFLRKSMEYLVSRRDEFADDPELLRSNLDFLRTLGEYDRIGLAILNDRGLEIKGHQRGYGSLSIVAPGSTQASDIQNEVLNNLTSLLKTFAIAGSGQAERIYETSEEDSEKKEQKTNAPGEEPRVVIKLHGDHQVTATFGPLQSKLFAHIVNKDTIARNKDKSHLIDLKRLAEPGQSHKLINGPEIFYESGEYKFRGSVHQFLKYSDNIQSACWFPNLIENLPGVSSKDIEINDLGLVINQPNGVNDDLVYILDAAHINMSIEKNRVILNTDTLSTDFYHYSSQIREEKKKIKEKQTENKKVDKNLKYAFNHYIKKEYNMTLYSGQSSMDQVLEGIRAGYVERAVTGESDNRMWVHGKYTRDLEFDRTAEDPKLLATDENRIDIINSSFLNISKLPEESGIESLNLNYWLSKLGGTETLNSNLELQPDGSIKIEHKTIKPFQNDYPQEGGRYTGFTNWRTNFYGDKFAKMAERFRSSELNDLLRLINDIAQRDIEVAASEGYELPESSQIKRHKTFFGMDVFATRDEMMTFYGDIVRTIRNRKISFSDLAAEADNVVIATRKLSEEVTENLFTDVEKLNVQTQEIIRFQKLGYINVPDEKLAMMKQMAAEFSRIDFLRDRIAREAQEVSVRIDGKTDQAASIRKSVADYEFTKAALRAENLLRGLVVSHQNEGELSEDFPDVDEVYTMASALEGAGLEVDFDKLNRLLEDGSSKGFSADEEKKLRKDLSEMLKLRQETGSDATLQSHLYENLSYVADFYVNYVQTTENQEFASEKATSKIEKYKHDEKKNITALKNKVVDKLSSGGFVYKALTDLKSALKNSRDAFSTLRRSYNNFIKLIIPLATQVSQQEVYDCITKEIPDEILYAQNQHFERAMHILQSEGWIESYSLEEQIFKPSKKMLGNQEEAARRIAEIHKGAKKAPDEAIMIIDTSSLISLLLGKSEVERGDPGFDKDIGSFKVIKGLCESGKAKIALSDMILAEFLDSSIPLRQDDVFYLDRDEKFRVKEEWKGKYTKRFEKISGRVEFLEWAINEKYLEIVETETSADYDKAVRNNDELKEVYEQAAKIDFNNKEWLDLSHRELISVFVNYPPMMSKIKSLGLRKDCGEISTSNVLRHYRNEYGMQAKIILFSDDSATESRFLYDYHKRYIEKDPSYKLEFGRLPSVPREFNPCKYKNNPSFGTFDRSYLQGLGELSILTYGGFEYAIEIRKRDEEAKLSYLKTRGNLFDLDEPKSYSIDKMPSEYDVVGVTWSPPADDEIAYDPTKLSNEISKEDRKKSGAINITPKPHSQNSFRQTFERSLHKVNELMGKPFDFKRNDAIRDCVIASIIEGEKHIHEVVAGKLVCQNTGDATFVKSPFYQMIMSLEKEVFDSLIVSNEGEVDKNLRNSNSFVELLKGVESGASWARLKSQVALEKSISRTLVTGKTRFAAKIEALANLCFQRVMDLRMESAEDLKTVYDYKREICKNDGVQKSNKSHYQSIEKAEGEYTKSIPLSEKAMVFEMVEVGADDIIHGGIMEELMDKFVELRSSSQEQITKFVRSEIHSVIAQKTAAIFESQEKACPDYLNDQYLKFGNALNSEARMKAS